MKKYLVLLVIPIFAYAGSPTIAQIEKAMQEGKITEVEIMSKEAVQEHPTSAKAHYFLGQAYFNENKMQLAHAEFVTAKKLDPSLSFTKKPEVFNTMLSRSMPLVKLTTSASIAKPASQESTHDNGIGLLNKVLLGLGILLGVLTGIGILLSIIKKSKQKLPDDLGPEFDLENESPPINQKPDSVDSQIVMGIGLKEERLSNLIQKQKIHHKLPPLLNSVK